MSGLVKDRWRGAFSAKEGARAELTRELTALEARSDALDSGGVNLAYAPLYERFGPDADILASHVGLLYERKRFADALNLVEAASSRGGVPDERALNSAGLSAYALGDETRAEAFFNAALHASGDKDPKALNNLAALCLAQHRPEEALAYLRRIPVAAAEARGELDERALHNKALALVMLGQEGEARRLLTGVVSETEADKLMVSFVAMASGGHETIDSYSEAQEPAPSAAEFGGAPSAVTEFRP